MSETSWTERPATAASGPTGAPSHRAIVSAALAAGALTVVWRFLTFSGFNNDHYVHVAAAQQIVLGEWPVRDFVDPAMPLMDVVHAAAWKAFGPALGVEWSVVAAGFAVGAMCTVVAAARLSGSIAVALLVALLEIAIYPRTFGYPKVLLYAAATPIIMMAARRFTTATVLALASITAVAFLFRHDHGVFIGIASATALVVASWNEGWRSGVRRSAAYVGVVGLLLLPWLAFVQVHQGLGAYIASSMSASQGEAVGNALRELPGLNLGEITSDRNALTWLFYTFHLLPMASLVVLLRREDVEAWSGETAVVAALIAMAIPVNLSFLRGQLDGRVPDAIVPAALLGSWLLGRVMRRPPARVPALIGAASIVMISAWAVIRVGDVVANLAKSDLLSGPRILSQRAADLWDRFHRRVPERDHIPSRYAGALEPFIQYVGRCTSPQDRLLVTGLFPEINVLANRGFAGGQISLRPFFHTSASDQALTVARLRRQSVPFVVSVRPLYPELKSQMPTVFEYVEQRFEPFVHLPVPETPGVDVLIERDRRASRVDVATGWPCFQ